MRTLYVVPRPFAFNPASRRSLLLPLIGLSVLAGTAILAHGSRFISTPPEFASGGAPKQVIAADMNQDGVQDLLVSNDNGKVTVLLGKGDDTFAPPTTIVTLAGGAPPLALGDFNNDRIFDFAALSKSANSVSIYLGNGNGTFTAPSKTSTPPSPRQIAVGDVNGDGHADVLVISPAGLSAFLGDGHGGLHAPITTSGSNSIYATNATSLAIGDLNHDGRLDVIVANPGMEFLGLGDGHFKLTSNTIEVEEPGSTVQVVVADLDGDGNLDLVEPVQPMDGRYFGVPINILWGNGDGTFQAGPSLSAGSSESSVVVQDFNNDGRPDVASANPDSNSVSMLLNQGGRTFATAVNYRTSKQTSGVPNLLATADFNSDNRPDLALATLTGIQVIRNVGGGMLYAPAPSNLAYGDRLCLPYA